MRAGLAGVGVRVGYGWFGVRVRGWSRVGRDWCVYGCFGGMGRLGVR